VFDSKYGTAMMVESGDYLAPRGTPMPVLWWPIFIGRRNGNVVEVLDSTGRVIAMTGSTYRIEGSFEPIGFVACGDMVTPEASAGAS
jgi:hypothetical protein